MRRVWRPNRFRDFDFKCRCMPFVNQRLSITLVMNGAYKSMSHMSLTSLTSPCGLHREYYSVLNNEKDIFDDDNLVHVKYRQRHDFNSRWY